MSELSLEPFRLSNLDRSQFINVLELLYIFMIIDGENHEYEKNFIANLMLINNQLDLDIEIIIKNLNNKLQNYDISEYLTEVARNLSNLHKIDKEKILISIKYMVNADNYVDEEEIKLFKLLLVVWAINDF